MRISVADRARRLWKDGEVPTTPVPVYVSMNDYWVHRRRDVVPVAVAGLRLRRAWPRTQGAVGLWFATYRGGRRQVSVSIWRDADDLRAFVRSPAHRRVVRTFGGTGRLHTSAWTTGAADREEIWRQAADRLAGRVPGVPHH